MNVVAVLGSPQKKGNSSSIATAFTRKAQSLGAKVSTHYLNEMRYRGCQGCMACKEKLEHCVLKDDLTQVLDAVHEADVVVMASPIYYHGVSGQFKTYFDRTYSFLKPNFFSRPDPCRLSEGKKGLVVFSQGREENAHRNVVKQYDYFLEKYGFEERRFIRAVRLPGSSSSAERKRCEEEASVLARQWCAQ